MKWAFFFLLGIKSRTKVFGSPWNGILTTNKSLFLCWTRFDLTGHCMRVDTMLFNTLRKILKTWDMIWHVSCMHCQKHCSCVCYVPIFLEHVPLSDIFYVIFIYHCESLNCLEILYCILCLQRGYLYKFKSYC
jgi:hypothetical protein